jgi:hypothetical protein
VIITEIEPPNVHIPAKRKDGKLNTVQNTAIQGKTRFSRPRCTSTSYTKLYFSCSRIRVESFAICDKTYTVSMMCHV